MIKRTRFKKNKFIDKGDHYEIVLYKGLGEQKEVARTLIDKDDYNKAIKYKWHLSKGKYAATTGIKLHQLIINKKDGLVIDHINQNALDNRKSNLRHITNQQNIRNTKKAKGYSWCKRYKKWRARIMVNYKEISLGYYKNKQDAIFARKKAELKYFKI